MAPARVHGCPLAGISKSGHEKFELGTQGRGIATFFKNSIGCLMTCMSSLWESIGFFRASMAVFGNL
eukprot:572569-Pyramimonas_sp.AAC.1